MLNIMYHYVRPYNRSYPHFNSLDICTFKKQLDFFEKEYGFLTKSEYQYSIKNSSNPKGVVLTFDDGFKDHVDYVLPELIKRGLWGIFYISTGVYQKKKLLGVHRVHYLKGRYGSKAILDEAYNHIDHHMLDHKTISQFDKEIYTGSNYEKCEKELRRLFNYFISYEYRDRVLDRLMEVFFNEDNIFKELYLSLDDIKKIGSAGNIIGSHTLSHRVLSRLSYQEQYEEINDSFCFINNLVDQDYKSFCYPYGYRSSYNTDTFKVLRELNVDDACAFDNKIQGDEINRYELSRIDCNQFLEV